MKLLLGLCKLWFYVRVQHMGVNSQFCTLFKLKTVFSEIPFPAKYNDDLLLNTLDRNLHRKFQSR